MDVVLDAGAGDAALVEADVVAVRLVDLLEPAHRALGQGHHLRQAVPGQILQAADVLEGRDHQVAVRVREEVEDHEAALAAVDDQARLVVSRRRLGAEDALLLDVLGRVLHVSEAPGRPDAEVGHGRSILWKNKSHLLRSPGQAVPGRGSAGARSPVVISASARERRTRRLVQSQPRRRK